MAANQQPPPWRFFGMGMEFAGTIAAMALIGYLFDRWLGSGPWGLVGGLIVGAIGGMYILLKRSWDALK